MSRRDDPERLGAIVTLLSLRKAAAELKAARAIALARAGESQRDAGRHELDLLDQGWQSALALRLVDIDASGRWAAGWAAQAVTQRQYDIALAAARYEERICSRNLQIECGRLDAAHARMSNARRVERSRREEKRLHDAAEHFTWRGPAE